LMLPHALHKERRKPLLPKVLYKNLIFSDRSLPYYLISVKIIAANEAKPVDIPTTS
jgi:hypothetical protein